MRIKFIQNLIDKLRKKKNHYTPYLPEIVQKLETIKKISNIKTLVLGSSHIEVSFIAESNEYNLALSSQDLYYSYQLYKKFNNKNIENIILSFSEFSMWSHNEYSPNAHWYLIVNLLTGIDFQNKLSTKNEYLYKQKLEYKQEIKQYIKKHQINNKFRGNFEYHPDGYKPLEIDKMNFYKNFLLPHDQLKFIKNFIEDTARNNQKLYIILTPMTEEYRTYLPDFNTLYSKLYKLVNENNISKNVQILNYYDDRDFSNKDFYDYQHLNKTGAIKLTKKIKDVIYCEN